MRILYREDLRTEKNIRLSKPSINRLIKEGKFPAPLRYIGQSPVWNEEVIDDYLRGDWTPKAA